MGNCGTFTKRWHEILIDFNFAYHAGYVTVSVLGLCVHEFFYSLLVNRTAASDYSVVVYRLSVPVISEHF